MTGDPGWAFVKWRHDNQNDDISHSDNQHNRQNAARIK
jgi:hypothetical protein